jgi:cell division protein FtsI/penicillin-binding protein 2
VYFIKLVNKYGESGLYPELGESYYAIGAKFGNSTPYVLYPDEVLVDKDVYCEQVKDFGRKAAKKYAEYEASGKKHRLIDAEYQPAWGQGNISMTPISLCRYVAAVANGGKMMRPRYVSNDTIAEFRQLLSEDEAQVLQECMKGQAAGRFGELSSHIGGKTGTPTRADKASTSGKSNDALYAFFVDASASANGHPIAVVIRMERVNDYSRLALKMAHDVVIPVLQEQGYIL